jgi:deoxyribonuclease-4
MIKPDNLLFGTAGIPSSTKDRKTAEGIARVRELNLDAMELEFVHSINISREKAPAIDDARKKANVILTCHAPYFINLNSHEREKWLASIRRITESAKITHLCGGWSVCFHPAYYMKDPPEATSQRVKEAIELIVAELKKENADVWVRPETAGKVLQFGGLNELFELSAQFDNVLPCIDWSHLHARSNGRYNTRKEFEEVLSMMEKSLGKRALQNVHFHCQGINYNATGERNHMMLDDSDLNYKELVKVWKDWKLKGVVIAESPDPQVDALLLKKTYGKA